MAIVCLISGAVQAQSARSVLREIAFSPVDIPGDVPAHLVTALAQDRRGFLWIGTQGGLVRYDAYSYRVFKPAPGNPRSLGSSYVRALLAASDGRIWIGTLSGGLSVYDPDTDAFETYRHDRSNPASLAHDRVEGLAEDRERRIWIATDAGLDRLDPRTRQIDHFRHVPRDPSSLAADQVRGVLVDSSGQVWVGTRDGLQRWRHQAGFERVASTRGAADSLAGQLVSKLFEDSKGRLWIGTTEHGAAVLDRGTFTLRRLRPRTGTGLSHFWVYAIEEAPDGAIWIGTFGSGIDIVNPESLEIMARLTHDAGAPDTIGGDRIGALLRDRSNVLWAGTWGEGLARHDPTTRAFVAIRHSLQRGAGLTHPAAVRTLQMTDGQIWVGTNGTGVDVFDESWRFVEGHRAHPSDPRALSDGAITCLAQGPDGSIWVATLDGILHRRLPGAAAFDRLGAAHGLPGGPIRAIAFGPDGAVWAGSANGLARIDPSTLRIDSFQHQPEDDNTLSARSVESIAVVPDGTLWIGTTNGLNVFQPESGRIVRIYADPDDRNALSNAWVPDLMVARDGRLWVGTQGGACVVTSWDGTTARFERVADRIGIEPQPAESLIEDADGHVWIGPLLRVDPRNWTAQVFGAGDTREFRSYFIASRASTQRGELMFGSPEGLLVVRPDRLQPWTFEPPLVATSIEVDGARQPGSTATLTLKPGTRGFRIEFAALDLTAPTRNRYRYVVENFDEGWTEVDAARRSLTYTNLPPGDYLVRVQGTNRAGRWSTHEITLPVTVQPAIHQSTAFRLSSLLVILVAAYATHHWRVRWIERRGRELEGLVASRTAELRDAYARIEEASLTDALTGLRNRRFIQQTVDADAAAVRRLHAGGEAQSGRADLVFFLLDIDHFKQVNDVHGHAAGDAVLVQLADILRGLTRTSDHVARWGGEEFLVVARFTDRNRGAELAEKIRAAVEAHVFRLPDGTELRKTCSLGFAAYPNVGAARGPHDADSASWGGQTWQAAIGIADAALYCAKREGRNRWVAG
ncbi:MAG TPA: two-component regulator propeller domain-containing protein [Vicinamibacterales bacterium]|nr:two-component regulator propeller domain-containing protein [Vicinamibacterales bacterium]